MEVNREINTWETQSWFVAHGYRLRSTKNCRLQMMFTGAKQYMVLDREINTGVA